MMRTQSRKIWYCRITLIILLFAVLLAWALLPDAHEFINRSAAAFVVVDQQDIERFIQSYGVLAAVVLFLLVILQVIVASLPAFLITFTSASLSGTFQGSLLSWTSSMADAALYFFIARVMNRGMVERLTGKTVLNSMDDSFTRCGKHATLVCRSLPFVPFGPTSYVVGLASARFRLFFIATGLSQSPATIIHSWAGNMLTGSTFWFVTGSFILFTLTMVIFMAKKIWPERRKRSV